MACELWCAWQGSKLRNKGQDGAIDHLAQLVIVISREIGRSLTQSLGGFGLSLPLTMGMKTMRGVCSDG